MGWTTTNKGRQTTKEWFESHLNGEIRDWLSQPQGAVWADCPLVGHHKVLKSTTKKFQHVGYAAVQSTWLPDTGYPKAGTSEVWCAVYLFSHSPKEAYYTFGYKDMDESMGPNESECPKGILDLLTPLPKPTLPPAEMDRLAAIADPYPLPGDVTYEDRRAAQSALHQADPHRNARQWRQRCRDNLRATQCVKKGALVTFATPIKFANKSTYQTFEYTGRGNQFHLPGNDGCRYNIRAWRDRDYTTMPTIPKKVA